MIKFIGIFACILLIVSTVPISGQLIRNVIIDDSEEINSRTNGNTWIRSFGGQMDDFGSSVQQTADGGYIIFGITESFGGGSNDYWLIKTDSIGNKIWDKTYGGENSDEASFGCQTSDDGYLIVGSTNSFDLGKKDIWLIKTDNQGDMIWNKTYGGAGYETASEVLQTNDGGIAIFGYTDSFGAGNRDMWLIKTDNEGNIIWEKTYGGKQDDQGNSIKQTTDGGFILAGSKYTSVYTTKFDIWLVKIDVSGEIIWEKTYGGDGDDYAWSVQQTSDGGYIICGEYYVGGVNEFDIFLLKTDSNGEVLWERIFNHILHDRGWSVLQTPDGGYIVAGDTFTGPNVDGILIKTDSNGDTQWIKTYGGHQTDITVHVQLTNDGGYILTGYDQPGMFQYRNCWLIKTDENGNVPRIRSHEAVDFSLFYRFINLFPVLKIIIQKIGIL